MLVRQYQHLGTYIDARGVTSFNFIERSRLALGVYAPIALKVFGSPHISSLHKRIFLSTLVLSRLPFNAHIELPEA